MKRKLKQWTAVLCLLMLLAASLHLARAESALTQEECAPYRIVLTAPGGWNRSNSAVITVNVKDEQNLGWYQMAYRMNDGDWTDCEQLFDKSKAEIAVHENGMFTFRITDPHGHTFEESTRVAVIDRSAPTVQASISGTTLQVEVQDDLSGVAGVQVNSMLFTEQAGSLIRIALDDALARYDTLSIRAFDYAGNFSEPVLLNNSCYEDAVRVTAAPTNSPKPTKQPNETKQPNSTAEITVPPTATKRPNGLGGSLIYVNEETAPTAAPTQVPSPTPVIQYVPIGPGMPYKADGNAHTLDVLYSAATNKQFITLQSKNGSTFYLVIDYDKPIDEAAEMYETYFLNLVDERDLLALLSDEEKEELPTPSPEIIYVTPVPTTVPMPTAAPEKGGSSDRMTAVLALGAILLLGGAGAFVLVKYRRNSARHRADNDFMLDDDDESAE